MPDVSTQAPAVSTESPFRVRIRTLEKEMKLKSDEQTKSNAIARETTKLMLEELRRIERGAGHSRLNPLTPRGNLLVIPQEILDENPDHHLRGVNERIDGRAEFLKAEGYERVPGDKRIGDLVLWRIPREKWAKSQAQKNIKTDRDLRRATTASREEQTARLQEYFEKEGVDVDVRQLMTGG